MTKLFYIAMIFSYLIANPIDTWVDKNKDIIDKKIKSVTFQIIINSHLALEKNKILDGNIIIGENKKFRFEIGPRTVVSDGTLWKSYDYRTDQVFIQEPDRKFEKILFSWINVKKLKALPVKKTLDGSYRIKFFGKDNEVRAYLNSDTNILDSIIISNQKSFKSKIFNISIFATDSMILDIGTDTSTMFDLR